MSCKTLDCKSNMTFFTDLYQLTTKIRQHCSTEISNVSEGTKCFENRTNIKSAWRNRSYLQREGSILEHGQVSDWESES